MRLSISQPMSGQLFYIDPMGRMPTIRCEAQLVDESQQVINVPLQWSLQIVENVWPGACPSAKVGKLMVNLQGMSSGRGLWTPGFNAAVGGDASLTVSATHAGNTYHAHVNFRLRGKNPSCEAVMERLGGERSALSLLARHISDLKHFDVQGMPLLGEHGEVGVMQLCDPAARQHQRWSWIYNVDSGKALLQKCQGVAKAHLDQHRVNDAYSNDQNLTDAQVLLREMLQRYLGGGYWTWDEAQQQWVSQPTDSHIEEMLSGR